MVGENQLSFGSLLFLTFKSIVSFINQSVEGAQPLSTKQKVSQTCLTNPSSIPPPQNITESCVITQEYVPNTRTWEVSFAGCETVVCPVPTKRPTKRPTKSQAPTLRNTALPTPDPTPKPVIPPTQEPTLPKITNAPTKPTKAPTRPTKRPTKKPTPAPTECMPAEKVSSDLFPAAQKLDKSAARTKIFEFSDNSLQFKIGMYQRGTGFISFLTKGIEYACLATLISNRTIVFPANCMLDARSAISNEWYESFRFKIGYGNQTNEGLTAGYLQGFYPQNWQENNAAVVVLNTAIGDATGWMNLATTYPAESSISQLHFDGDYIHKALIAPCVGTNNIPEHGAILFSQQNSKNNAFIYSLVGLSGGEEEEVVGAEVISVMQDFANNVTRQSMGYSGLTLSAIKDRSLGCKYKAL